MEWIVAPFLRDEAARPVDAVTTTSIFFANRSFMIILSIKVLPVPAGPSTNKSYGLFEYTAATTARNPICCASFNCVASESTGELRWAKMLTCTLSNSGLSI